MTGARMHLHLRKDPAGQTWGAEQRGSALPGGVMPVPKGEGTPKPTLEEE